MNARVSSAALAPFSLFIVSSDFSARTRGSLDRHLASLQAAHEV